MKAGFTLPPRPWKLSTEGIFIKDDVNRRNDDPFPPAVLKGCGLQSVLTAAEIDYVVRDAETQLGKPSTRQLFEAFEYYIIKNRPLQFEGAPSEEQRRASAPSYRFGDRDTTLKIDVTLKLVSADRSRQFYVDELGMFEPAGIAFDFACRFKPRYNKGFTLSLSTGNQSNAQPAFFLLVPNCCLEFNRLRTVHFSSGGRIVPDRRGELSMFEYPGGQNFMMEDPNGNRFVIHEDFVAEVAE